MVDEPEEPSPSQLDELRCAEGLNIIRVRYFYNFSTPFLVKCRRETLFYNNSDEAIREIQFKLSGFRKHLHIFDSNNRPLEFHKEFYEYSNGNNLTEEQDDVILIDLPENHLIDPNTFRTIIFEYLEEAENYIGANIVFDFNLGEAHRTYISIDSSLTKFKLIKHYYVHASDGSLFPIEELDESEDVYIKSDMPSSIYFEAGRKIEGCSVYVIIGFAVEKFQKSWFDLGIAIGIIAFVLNIVLLYLYSGLLLSVIIPFIGLVNAYLLITKGWLFENDMERVLKTNYDTIYIILISALIIELIAAFIITLFFHHVSFNANISFEMIINGTRLEWVS